MNDNVRIGIFGGTFSPPHIGHVRVANALIRDMRLDRLLVIPDYLPPHKELQGDASAEQRLEMTRLAFAGIPRVEVSNMELLRGGKSYTVDTLHELAAENVTLVLYCGTDMLLSLDCWYHAPEIFALAEIAYALRSGDPKSTEAVRAKAEEYRTRFGSTVTELSLPVTEISSSDVREAIRTGRSVSDYLSHDVEAYIRTWNLYHS